MIPGAVHIPRSVLEWRADPESAQPDERIADRDAPLVLMCNDGFSSSLAAASLRAMGFSTVADMERGFAAWKGAGLPLAGGEGSPLPDGGGPE